MIHLVGCDNMFYFSNLHKKKKKKLKNRVKNIGSFGGVIHHGEKQLNSRF